MRQKVRLACPNFRERTARVKLELTDFSLMVQATPLVMRVATNECHNHEPYEDVYTSQDENMLRGMHQVQMSTM